MGRLCQTSETEFAGSEPQEVAVGRCYCLSHCLPVARTSVASSPVVRGDEGTNKAIR